MPRKPARPKEIPIEVKRALATRRPGADSEALLNDLIEVWGGTRKLALDLHQEFQKASEGGMTRQRILEMIQRLIVTNTTHDIGRTRQPSDLDDGELEQVALAYLERMKGHAAPPA